MSRKRTRVLPTTALIVLGSVATAQDSVWHLAGNAGIRHDTDFLGTIDDAPLVVKTNDVERMRVASGASRFHFPGGVGIGTISPQQRLHVFGNMRVEAVHSELPEGVLGPPPPPGTLPPNALDLRTDGDDVDVQALTRSLFLHSSAPPGRNNVLLNPFPNEGNVGIGTPVPEAKLHVNGRAKVQVLEITGGGDVAESFSVHAGEVIETGTLMVIDETGAGQLRVSDRAYDPKVAGVVSGASGLRPAVMLQPEGAGHSTPIAVSGRVYCKAEALLRPIRPGDLLTTSARKGFAMKASRSQVPAGTVFGKALTGLERGTGLILVLVGLQ